MPAPDQLSSNDGAGDPVALSLEDELLSAMAEIEGMKSSSEAPPPPQDRAADTPESEKSADAAPKGLKFKIGKKGDGTPGTAAGKKPASATSAPTKASVPIDQITGALPSVGWVKRGVRGIDALLEFASVPMAILPPSLRKAFGVVSIVTIAVSGGSAMLLPMVLPYRDAVTFLTQRRAALETESHAQAEGHSAGGEGGGHSEPKDAHGDKKADKKPDPHAKADAHGGGHDAKPEKKPEKKDDGHGGSKKKDEKKPPKKDAKKKSDKKSGDGHGGGGGH